MKRFFLLLIGCTNMLCISMAQVPTVTSMEATNDLSASQYRRADRNNEPCGLVKVSLATAGALFEGNVIQPVEYKTGEYWVYMTKGSRELRIKHPQFVPLHVKFTDYGIKDIQPLTTYILTLLMPQSATPQQTQKVIFNYSPANAIVVVDSKSYQGNGHLELTLPVGSHDYQIVAVGYSTAEGSVKLNADTPRTITENLIAISSDALTTTTIQDNTSPKKEQETKSFGDPFEEIFSDFYGRNDKKDTNGSPNNSPNDTDNNGAVETITVNGISFNMVRVDGGTFKMGATKEQGSDAESDEKPAHQVTLPSYSIGETEVTQELWQAVMGSNPSVFKGKQKPVEYVSWDDCQTFISKLNQLTGKSFRLPTEAEWEYAARGGSKSRGYKYSGSNNIDDVAWYAKTTNDKGTRDVKTKQANELGLYDMSGNVGEWCQDFYYDYRKQTRTNPSDVATVYNRVSRGGCWVNSVKYCRVSYRCILTPTFRFSYYGLRLAL